MTTTEMGTPTGEHPSALVLFGFLPFLLSILPSSQPLSVEGLLSTLETQQGTESPSLGRASGLTGEGPCHSTEVARSRVEVARYRVYPVWGSGA